MTQTAERLGLRPVDGEERVGEIVRLLGGDAAAGPDEASQAAYARNLLRERVPAAAKGIGG